jgi:hypothetical protein
VLRLRDELEDAAHRRTASHDVIGRLGRRRGSASRSQAGNPLAQDVRRGAVAHDELLHAAGQKLGRVAHARAVDQCQDGQAIAALTQPAGVGEGRSVAGSIQTDRLEAVLAQQCRGLVAVSCNRTALVRPGLQ